MSVFDGYRLKSKRIMSHTSRVKYFIIEFNGLYLQYTII